jgi:hypothetical protein
MNTSESSNNKKISDPVAVVGKNALLGIIVIVVMAILLVLAILH